MVGWGMGHTRKLVQAQVFLIIKSNIKALMGMQSWTKYFNRILFVLNLLGQIGQYGCYYNAYLVKGVILCMEIPLISLVQGAPILWIVGTEKPTKPRADSTYEVKIQFFFFFWVNCWVNLETQGWSSGACEWYKDTNTTQ